VAGLTLGGGIGWLMRKHGLTCDNLLAVDLVSADGRRVRVDGREHPDLLWGVRGGGGNFGVVTAFQFRLHQVGPQVLAGPVLYPAEQAGEVLRGYRSWAADAPGEVSTVVNLRLAPPLPIIPERLHGVPVVTIVCCYAGADPDAGERLLAPVRRLGTPLLDLVAVKPYAAHQATFDATVPHGLHYHWRSHYLDDLGDGAVDTLVDHAWSHRSPWSYTILFQLGGAVRRLPEEATAFSGRGAGYALNINAVATGGDGLPEQAAWARRTWEAMRPHGNGVYVNFLDREGNERVRAAYGEAKWRRLAELKRTWDPDNLFRLNQNITPD
jgi:FAD/FMN-containing dehydrogenase